MEYDEIWSVYNTITQPTSSSESAVEDEVCAHCHERQIYTDTVNGNLTCAACGYVAEAGVIDQTAEWNAVNDPHRTSKDPSRCGCPINPMLNKSSMSTMIVSNKHRFMKRLHQQMSMDYVERSRYHVFESISKVAGDIGQLPPNVIEQAKFYYKTLSERKLSRGDVRKGLIACCIFHACKAMNVPRSLKEISSITSVPTTVLNRTNKLFMKLMHDVSGREATECKHLISRFCNQLHLSKADEHKLVRYALKLDRAIQESGLLDCKTPSAVSAGIIVYASEIIGIEISKYQVSSLVEVSVVTINKISKVISENRAVLESHMGGRDCTNRDDTG
jgi:transcription initiation factor TFIIB